LYEVDMPNSYLIAESGAPINAFKKWTGRKIMCSLGDRLIKIVEQMVGEFGYLRVWGSVATLAYDVAVKLGCDPIIFVGQDLSYPGGRTYVEGTFFEEKEKHKMTTEEMQGKGEQLVVATDIYGNSVHTNKQMFGYYHKFCEFFKDSTARLINATEGGILVHEKVEQMTLQQVMDTVLTKEYDIDGELDKIYKTADRVDPQNIYHKLRYFTAIWRQAKADCVSGIKEAVKIRAILNKEPLDMVKLKECYLRLVKFQQDLVKSPETVFLFAQLNQMAMYLHARAWRDTREVKEFTEKEYQSVADGYGAMFLITYTLAEEMLSMLSYAYDITDEVNKKV
jgi:hypothetical protein